MSSHASAAHDGHAIICVGWAGTETHLKHAGYAEHQVLGPIHSLCQKVYMQMHEEFEKKILKFEFYYLWKIKSINRILNYNQIRLYC